VAAPLVWLEPFPLGKQLIEQRIRPPNLLGDLCTSGRTRRAVFAGAPDPHSREPLTSRRARAVRRRRPSVRLARLIEEGQLAVMDERPIAVQLASNRRVKTGWSRSVVTVCGTPVFVLQTG
jgi:hypothetical protein